MKDQYRSKNAAQALAHLCEELGEATAAAGKALRWGPKSVNPELPPEEQVANIDWLMQELQDVEEARQEFRRLYLDEVTAEFNPDNA